MIEQLVSEIIRVHLEYQKQNKTGEITFRYKEGKLMEIDAREVKRSFDTHLTNGDVKT